MSRIDDIKAKLLREDEEVSDERFEQFKQEHPVAYAMGDMRPSDIYETFGRMLGNKDDNSFEWDAASAVVSLIVSRSGIDIDRFKRRMSGSREWQAEVLGAAGVMLENYYQERKRRENAPKA